MPDPLYAIGGTTEKEIFAYAGLLNLHLNPSTTVLLHFGIWKMPRIHPVSRSIAAPHLRG